MGFRDFFSTLPLVSQVPRRQFYVKGYTEALSLFSDVRVVLNEEWMSGVPHDLLEYFYRVKFPCYFIPIFRENNCFGFVVKGFSKETPRFCTNNMLLPGCERIKGGEVVVLVEGCKDCMIPMLALKGLYAVVIPMLTAVPSREFLGFLKEMKCTVVYASDNDEYRANHTARFYELCGKIGLLCFIYDLKGSKDFGDFFDISTRDSVLSEGKRLREVVKSLITN